MYDLTKYQDIKNHLIRISPTFDDVGNHYVICCPYCDDAIRKQVIDHGHCYISKTIPVFYCHRCDATGIILDLLKITEYDNIDIINELKQIIQFKIGRNYLRTTNISTNYNIDNYISNQLKKLSNDQYNEYTKYLNYRLGLINYEKFCIFPDIIDNQLVVGFMNYNGHIICYRYIHGINNKRYKKQSDYYYYFQNIEDIYKYDNIIICEGQFDLISLYLYSIQFSNSFFIAVNGKNYINCVKELIYNYLLLDSKNINIVFDNDTYYQWQKQIIRKLNIVVSNTNNTIQGFKPKYLKDSNDCSELILF